MRDFRTVTYLNAPQLPDIGIGVKIGFGRSHNGPRAVWVKGWAGEANEEREIKVVHPITLWVSQAPTKPEISPI